MERTRRMRRRAPTRGKKTPEIIHTIEILLEHDTAGDPITGLKWTRMTTERIAEVLQEIDIQVSPNTVARLSCQMDFSLRVNRKQIATAIPALTGISNSSIFPRCARASSVARPSGYQRR